MALKQTIKNGWQRIYRGPWLVLGSLVLMSVLSFGLFLNANAERGETSTKAKPAEAQVSQSESNSSQPRTTAPAGGAPGSSKNAGSSAANNNQPSGNSPSSIAANPTAPVANPIQIAVNINHRSSFTLSVPSGANHCDVLSTALSAGKISQLDMRYIQSYGSYGVYQINGVGKNDSVWWTYTVNGTSPNKGCSYVKVNNNDQIVWRYIGP